MMVKTYQLAQINIARLKGANINDPIVKEFADNIAVVNELAEQSEGFVWRLKDDTNNATNLNPYNDEQIIINVSVWEDIDSLATFTYKFLHSEFLKRRKEWFQNFGKAYFAMWWIPTGQFPTIEEAIKKLDYFQQNGATPLVFDFKKKFEKPI
jgi:Domain of unknown function (DUF3291)